MRIGILTFHRAHNYGAILQAYALQTVLENMGNNVSLVDYEIKSMMMDYKWVQPRQIFRKNIFAGLKVLLRLPKAKKRYDLFRSFIKIYLNEDKHGISDLDKHFDTIVVGSDQVFNPNITRGIHNAYWGELPSFSGKLITYAASTENLNVDNKDIGALPDVFSRFDALSVREDSVAALIAPFVNKEIHISLDPTLLIGKDKWEEIAIKPRINKKYVFFYYVRLEGLKETLSMARRFAKNNDLELVVLSAWNCHYSTSNSYCSGPREFLGWIHNAEYVISSSFHCTVFSLIFNKPFFSVTLKDGQNGRIEALLSAFKLEDRIITSLDEPKDCGIDWIMVNQQMKAYPINSLDYLTTVQ